MNYDSIHYSLELINGFLNTERSIYRIPIMTSSVENPNFFSASGEFRYEYRAFHYSIATKLNLFEVHELKASIYKALTESSQPNEIKSFLANLLPLAKSNLDLYGEVNKIKYTDGSYNSEFEGIPIVNSLKYLNIEENKRAWNISRESFEGDRYRDYKRSGYSVEDFYYYSKEFYTYVNETLGEWIEERDKSKRKTDLEIKELDNKVNFWKDIRWYGGLITGAISSIGILAAIYFQWLKCK